MRWISYAMCLGVVVIQLASSMPTSQENASSALVKENLQNVNTELQNPTMGNSGRQKRTIGVFRRIFPELSKTQGGNTNALFDAPSEKKEVRVPYVPANSKNDLQTASSEGDSEGAETSQEEFNDDINIETDENSRSKRLGVFGNLFGGATAGASAEGGGGSGNFLFDIIRKTADGAARTAGTVYRWVAGTDDSGLQGLSAQPVALAMAAQTPVTASVPLSPAPADMLVAGSGSSEQQDEHSNTAIIQTDEIHQPVEDGYQTGIPGPITRLFVIANRGIANLMQDLILRLAQTSERIVNFKARLITAII